MVPFSADTGLKVSVGVFFLTSFFLTSSYNATYAFDRPVSTAVLAYILLGIAFTFLGRFYPSSYPCSSPSSKRFGIPPAQEFELPSRASSPSPALGLDQRVSFRTVFWLKLAFILILLGLRVELFRRVTLNTECTPAGYSYIIPFIISLYDYWCNQRSRPRDGYTLLQQSQNIPNQSISSSCRKVIYYLTQSRLRGIFAAALISVGGYTASSFLAGSRSTYICPIVLKGASHFQVIRLVNVIVDSLLLIGVTEFLQNGMAIEEPRRRRPLIWFGAGLLLVAVIWMIIGIFVTNTRPEHSGQPLLDAKYSRSAFGQALLVLFFVLSAWQMLPHYGVLGLAILAGFVLVFFSSTSTLFFEQMPFPYISQTQGVVSVVASSTGAFLFLLSRIFWEESSKSLNRTNIVLQVIVVVLCVTGLIFASTKHHFSHTHPIDILIRKGTAHYDDYILRARSSLNLEDAVWEYRRRYRRDPPPGFDKWYQYATSRSSVIIDDFDQIHKNLLPFQAISPAQLRSMTQQLATNPFNDLGAISIRAGQVHVQEGIKPTHAWMISGAANMIEKFSEHLPDMDLVFNLNDEPRVAVPWEKMQPLLQAARPQEPAPEREVLDRWSPDRQDGWGPIEPAHQTNETIFTDGAWRGIFDPYVSAVCPPSSRVRTRRVWNRHDICLSCAAPHTMGQFPINFDLATELCHQPDLAFLHGLLISPASFKVSQELIPVFSQSALAGFNDILFPSPWNYMDKAKYEPSYEHPDQEFSEKNNSLYWVGSTSEGYSRFNEWKGMPRQRFSHLVNNNTDNQVSVLLPAGPRSWEYEIMDGSAPSRELNLRAEVHLASPITRCGDCDTQRDELGTSSWVDFQAHWSHRFLFDLDGAGFSGRFLPFLQSRSLPLRTGLFRQWFDSRIVSWLHFVPVDIRLHGLWSTLAYFAGVPNPNAEDLLDNKPPMRMEAHINEGWWIAEQGRKWAEIALRKEDMEIYFFRLLLEWGRLTDDQRDVLGYKLAT
ncbi:hypothetical protein N7462_003024 [Penicillium macrosclerotiorum]|uniref:uncharacterized protein n=1 Tax=Penicillium macrosclerotiorum TaxID=303699 RepID=UPI0025475C16|nr:uncharacterized protein N7462_003024 [Penicillium macrosclerotiorum]KAJ5688632.1 hypothetical protein N7462_003024 [Penicillium macrosclerotiorum]